MDSSELNKFIKQLKLLLGNKEQQYIQPTHGGDVWKSKNQTFHKTTNNELTICTDELSYDIESLKIKYKVRDGKFNIRRAKSKNTEIKLMIIPLTLYDIDSITLNIVNELHGREVVSVEFVSNLYISMEKEDEDQYVKYVKICDFGLFIHTAIDKTSNIYINIQDGCISIVYSNNINNKHYPKIPFYSNFNCAGWKNVNIKKIEFND